MIDLLGNAQFDAEDPIVNRVRMLAAIITQIIDNHEACEMRARHPREWAVHPTPFAGQTLLCRGQRRQNVAHDLGVGTAPTFDINEAISFDRRQYRQKIVPAVEISHCLVPALVRISVPPLSSRWRTISSGR